MFSNVVSLHQCPRQEVVLCQIATRGLREVYDVHVLSMRTLALLSSWRETLSCTTLCVPCEETYAYSLGGNNSLQRVDIATTVQTTIAQISGLSPYRNRVCMDCNSEVLVVTDGRLMKVLRRGSYGVVTSFTLRTQTVIKTFAYVDDKHLFIRRVSEEHRFDLGVPTYECAVQCYRDMIMDHTINFSFERQHDQVCVDKGHGLLEFCFFDVRRLDFDGKCWATRHAFPGIAVRPARILSAAKAVSYAGDHVAVVTEYGNFVVIPTQELRCAWMALCTVRAVLQ